MTPGTILFDTNFRFRDGKIGSKLFIALNDGSKGVYVCAKTTSNDHRYGLTVGCQVMQRFPNFFIPKHACCLGENTWIQLEAFYEFDTAGLIQKVMSQHIKRIGVLETKMTKELITCATHAEDLSRFQEQELARQLGELASAAPEKGPTTSSEN